MTDTLCSSLINGLLMPNQGTELALVYPGTGERFSSVFEADAAMVENAVLAARAAHQIGIWKTMLPAERQHLLLRLAGAMREHADELGRLDSEDMGKPIQSAKEDVDAAAEIIEVAANAIPFLDGKVFSSGAHCLSYAKHEPVGVVAAITPWNYPTPNIAYKLGSALAMGNCVVLKPSEVSPRSALRVAQLAYSVGLPEGVLQVLIGRGHTVGAALATHKDVDLITFTGSTAVGKKIMIGAGESNAKRTLIECGGKSPQIVFSDLSNPERAVDHWLGSAFANSGQLCVAKTRLLLHQDIADDMIALIKQKAPAYAPADPSAQDTVYGPLAFKGHYLSVKKHIQQAKDDGLTLVYEGEADQHSQGFFVQPTIFDHVHSDAALAQNEVFGPVLAVQRFSTEEEAIAIANDSAYGLSAALWTGDIARARRVSQAVNTGSVDIFSDATPTEDYAPAMSCEPMKQSGFGSEGGMEGVKAYGVWKAYNYRS